MNTEALKEIIDGGDLERLRWFALGCANRLDQIATMPTKSPLGDPQLVTGIPTNQMDIGLAIDRMRSGHKVAREGWNGKGMWLALQVPDAHSKMTLPYIYMFTAQQQLVPWLASQSDLLAQDWMVVDAD